MKRLLSIIGLLAATGAGAVSATHEHGVARLDIAVESSRITLQLETPLDNLVGFERAPRTAAERKALESALARLRDAASLVTIDPAGGCKAGAVELKEPGFGRGEHADVQATWVFDCQDGARAAALDARLFDTFARLQRVRVQLVLPKGQRSITLRRPTERITLRR